mgnify:CR=1 FL=1
MNILSKEININWGTVAVKQDKRIIVFLEFFKNTEAKLKCIRKANQLVKSNKNGKVTHQVSIWYGIKPIDIMHI